MGLVRGEDHQGVLEHAVPAQAVEEGGHGAVHLGHGGDLARRVAGRERIRHGVGLVRAHGEQGEHPRLFAVLQPLDVLARPAEEDLVRGAPLEREGVGLGEPFAAVHLLEADGRHDLVLAHELQARALEEVGRPALVGESGGQALLGPGRVGEQFEGLGRVPGKLAEITAEERIQAADGLVTVHGEIRDEHAPGGRPRQFAHIEALCADAHGPADLRVVEAGRALEHDDEHVLRSSRTDQPVAVEIQGAQGRGQGLLAHRPRLLAQHGERRVLDEPVQGIVAGRHRLFVIVAAHRHLHEQDGQRQKQTPADQRRPGQAHRQQAKGQRGQQLQADEHRPGQFQAGGTRPHELGIGQVVQVLPGGQPLHGRKQLHRGGLEQGPEEHQPDPQPGGCGQGQAEDEPAQGQVGEQAHGFAQAGPGQAGDSRQEARGEQDEQDNIFFHGTKGLHQGEPG